MLKTLLKQLGKYKSDSVICTIFTLLEVLFETMIPYTMIKINSKYTAEVSGRIFSIKMIPKKKMIL